MRKPAFRARAPSSSSISAAAVVAWRRRAIADVGGPVAADRPRLDVDLDDRRVRVDQRAVLGRPVVDRGAEDEHEVGLGEQLGGERRGEPAGDPERVGQPANRPLAGAEVARIAPIRSPSASSSVPASARTAPRPAMIAGRSRRRSCSATAITAPHRRLGRARQSAAAAGAMRLGVCAAGCGWMSIGSISTTGRRSVMRPLIGALRVVGGGLRALDTRSAIAPTDSTRSCWSIRKLLGERRRRRLAGEHEQRRSALRRLGEAGHRVRQPGPWCTLTTPTRPLTRA